MSQTIAPGSYVTEGGWGELKVQPGGGFRIEATGVNAHTCEVEGKVKGMKAVSSESCEIDFEMSLDRVHVTPSTRTEQQCRSHCGMRAHFEGDYFRAVPACAAEPVSAQRAAFKRHYDARRYREAAEVLSALVHRCGRFLDWQVDAQVRNDLGIAYHHLKDDAACLGVLEPLRRAFVEDPAVSGRSFAPADQDWAEPMAVTTRFNWKACGGVLPK